MTSINLKVIGLIRPEIESTGSGLEPAIFGFPDLRAREAGALLIRPPRLVLVLIITYILGVDVTESLFVTSST